jgi:predicted transcriptional regulator of viral defense system
MLERTLVDLTVRPLYAGGVPEVLEAYRRAREEVSMMKLLAVLKRFQYVYPYHQAVGFYMERSGYRSSQFEQLRQKGFEFDFYLGYGMPEKEYDSNWRLYIPKGL